MHCTEFFGQGWVLGEFNYMHMHWFPIPAVKNYHKFSSINKHRYIILKFWRSGSKIGSLNCDPTVCPQEGSVSLCFPFLEAYCSGRFVAPSSLKHVARSSASVNSFPWTLSLSLLIKA